MCFHESEIEEEYLEVQPYPEGIYFDMLEDEYHNIPYFSRSTCEVMLFDTSGEEYWHKSKMNPNYKPFQTTAAMELGSAIHCAILEPERFALEFVQEPTIADMQGKIVLNKVDDFKHFLKKVGESISGTKDKLIERCSPYLDPEQFVIWDHVMAAFWSDVMAENKTVLRKDAIEIIEGIIDSINKRPNMPKLLENIRSEITIIWEDERTGLMCKCRLDGARPEAIVEVKSFSIANRKGLKKAMYDAINYEHYNLQYFVYHQALQSIIKKIKAKKAKVYGEVDEEWLKQFLHNPNKQFFILFARTQAPYQTKAIEMKQNFTSGASPNVYFTEAQSLWEFGITAYQICFEKFGVSEWLDDDDIDELEDENVPQIMYQSSGL